MVRCTPSWSRTPCPVRWLSPWCGGCQPSQVSLARLAAPTNASVVILAAPTMPCEVVVALVWFARMKLNWHARMKLNCLDARVQEETQAVHAHARARTHTHTHTHTQVHTNTHTNTHTHPFRLVIFGFDGAMACTCFMLTLSAGGTCSYCQAETKKG